MTPEPLRHPPRTEEAEPRGDPGSPGDEAQEDARPTAAVCRGRRWLKVMVKMWYTPQCEAPRCDVSWLTKAPVTIVKSAINHSDIGVINQLRYRTGASHCRNMQKLSFNMGLKTLFSDTWQLKQLKLKWRFVVRCAFSKLLAMVQIYDSRGKQMVNLVMQGEWLCIITKKLYDVTRPGKHTKSY